MNKNTIENFLDDIEIGKETKEFWRHLCPKLSLEEIEAFNFLKKENPKDIEKVIDILMRKEKAMLKNDAKELKNILEEEKKCLRVCFKKY